MQHNIPQCTHSLFHSRWFGCSFYAPHINFHLFVQSDGQNQDAEEQCLQFLYFFVFCFCTPPKSTRREYLFVTGE